MSGFIGTRTFQCSILAILIVAFLPSSFSCPFALGSRETCEGSIDSEVSGAVAANREP